MLLRTPVGKTAITSLLRGKLLTAVSCSCLPVNNFAIFAKNIHERFPTCVSKICIVISVVPWRCPLGDNRNFDWRVSLLIQWKWPVRQRTGLTKNTGHPCRRFLCCLSPRLLATLGFVIAVSPLKNRQATQASLHNKVFNCALKESTDVIFLSKWGSEFHHFGAAAQKLDHLALPLCTL